MVTVGAELTEILEQLQLEELAVRGVVNGLGLPLLIGNHVVPGPQKAHLFGHIGVVGVSIDASREVRLLLLSNWGFHLGVVVGGAPVRDKDVKETQWL